MLTAISLIFIIFLVLSVNKMISYYQISSQMGTLENLTEFTPKVGDLIHELQKERGASAGYIGSKASSGFTNDVYRKFISLIAQQESFLSTFDANANPEIKTYYTATLTGDVIEDVNIMRAHVFKDYANVSTSGITGGQWFDVITKKIDLYHKVENKFTAYIGKKTNVLASAASAVEEQSAATAEIARNVQEAARGSQEVTTVIVDVSSGATETGSIAEDVNGAANEVNDNSRKISSVVDSFLSSIRAL